jgi:hypothetical protein
VQPAPPAVEGEAGEVVRLEVVALWDAQIVAEADGSVVKVVADEDGNNEAEAEGLVAQGSPGCRRIDSFLEAVVGEEYGIGEVGYAVGHWGVSNTSEVEGCAVGHRRVLTMGEVEGEEVDYNAAAVAVSGEVAVGMLVEGTPEVEEDGPEQDRDERIHGQGQSVVGEVAVEVD